MYESFFGLRERPFQLTPDTRFLFLTPRHREALATLRYGLSGPRGITLLLGEAGTGKTTVLRAALRDLRQPNSRHVVVSNPTLTRAEFYEFLADGFQVARAGTSKARFLLDLQADILIRTAQGGMSAIVIDEAQSLPYELLEEIRLLANFETETEKLLNVVLVGQQELADRLNDVSLRQLKQRVSLRCTLTPLDLRETASYIAKRIRVAGGDSGTVFTREAVLAIHEASRGIPRTIGVVCDNALVGGFAAQERPVGVRIVADVCRDFDLNGNGDTASEPLAHAVGMNEREALHAGRRDSGPPAVAHDVVPHAGHPGHGGHAAPVPIDGHRAEAPVRPREVVRPAPAPSHPGEGDGRAPMFGFVEKKRRFSFF